MSNVELNTPSNKPAKVISNHTEITKKEKIILAVLLFIICIFLLAIGQKMFRNRLRLSPANNRLMVGAVRYRRLFAPDSLQYIFSLALWNKNNIELFSDLTESAELSPDRQWIVFSRQERESNIYIMRADGSQQTLIPIPHGGEDPTWSPDGKQIAFYRRGWWEARPMGPAGIYVTNIECLLRGESCTPKLRLLVEQTVSYPIAAPDWSPDGRKIAYSGGERIAVIDVSGHFQPVELRLSGTSADPQWSPDGTKIVGICHGLNISGVCIMNSDGSNVVYLKQDTPGNYADQPSWSPDGQMIAFISTFSAKPMPQICFPDGCGPVIFPSSIFVMNADGSGLTHLPFKDDVVIKWFFWYR